MCDGWWNRSLPFYLPYLHSPCGDYNPPQFAALWPSRYYRRNYLLLVGHTCSSKYVRRVCPSTVWLSSHPYFVPEGRPVSFYWGLSPVSCPSWLVGQCHNSTVVAWPSHRILTFCIQESHGKSLTPKCSLYLFVWASLCVLFILFFTPSFCNGPETELKWKTDTENLYNICVLSYTDSWCLVPFSSNISWYRKYNMRTCCGSTGNRALCQSPNKRFLSSEWSTQQATCYTKHAVTNNSCNSNAYHSEWGFGLEFVDGALGMEGVAKCFWPRKWNESVA